jgi:stage II sporulation protein D
LKKRIVFTTGIILFVFFASIAVAKIGNGNNINNNYNIEKYEIKPASLTLNKNYGDELKINVYIKKKDSIRNILLEDYVKGVVAAEMPAEFNVEALKAQVVAVRTFALAHMTEFDGGRCSEAEGGDVCDTVHCQVYISKEDKVLEWAASKREEYWNKIETAVLSTKGQILTYDGKLVMSPYYFSTSSGRTENSKEIFNTSEPYLVSVISPGEETAPKYNEFIRKVNNSYNNAGLTEKSLKSEVRILSRSKGAGTVVNIKLGNITISGAAFRKIFNLNSANFDITFSKSININCIGYGHDVGMSQFGANVMAGKGEGYAAILKHYYKGVEVQRIKIKE